MLKKLIQKALLRRIIEALNKRIKDKEYKPELEIPWAQF